MHETIVYHDITSTTVAEGEKKCPTFLIPTFNDNLFCTVAINEICLWTISPFKIVSQLQPSYKSSKPIRQILPSHLPTQNWIAKRTGTGFNFIISYEDGTLIGFHVGENLVVEEVSHLNTMGEIIPLLLQGSGGGGANDSSNYQSNQVNRTYGSSLKITKNRSSFIVQEINSSILLLSHPLIRDLTKQKIMLEGLNFSSIDKLITINDEGNAFATSTPSGFVKIYSLSSDDGSINLIWENNFNTSVLVIEWIYSNEIIASFSDKKIIQINPFNNTTLVKHCANDAVLDIISLTDCYVFLSAPLILKSTKTFAALSPQRQTKSEQSTTTTTTTLTITPKHRTIYDNSVFKMDFYTYYPSQNTLYTSTNQAIRVFPLLDNSNSIVLAMNGHFVIYSNSSIYHYNGNKIFIIPGRFDVSKMILIPSSGSGGGNGGDIGNDGNHMFPSTNPPFILVVTESFGKEEIVLFRIDGNNSTTTIIHRQYTTVPIKSIHSASPNSFGIWNQNDQLQIFYVEDQNRLKIISQQQPHYIHGSSEIKKILYSKYSGDLLFYSLKDGTLFDCNGTKFVGHDFFSIIILEEMYLFIIGKTECCLYYLDSEGLRKWNLINSFTGMEDIPTYFLADRERKNKVTEMDLIIRSSGRTSSSPTFWTPILFHFLQKDIKRFKTLATALFTTNEQGFLLLELLLVFVLRYNGGGGGDGGGGMDSQDRLMNLIKVTLSPCLPPLQYRRAIVSFLRHIEPSDSLHFLTIFGPYNAFFDICCQSGQCDLAWILLRQYVSNLFGNWSPGDVSSNGSGDSAGDVNDNFKGHNNSNVDFERYSPKDCLMICNNFQLLLNSCTTSSIMRDAIRLFDELPPNCQYDTKWFKGTLVEKVLRSHDHLVLVSLFRSGKASIHLKGDDFCASTFKDAVSGQSMEERRSLISIFNADFRVEVDRLPLLKDEIILLIEEELRDPVEAELFLEVFINQ